MAYRKELRKTNLQTQRRALASLSGFIHFISGKVKHHGLETVLKAEPNSELYWLKMHFRKVLDFAEQIHLKAMPQKIEADVTQTVYMTEIKKDDQPLRYNIGSDLTEDFGHSGQDPSRN